MRIPLTVIRGEAYRREPDMPPLTEWFVPEVLPVLEEFVYKPAVGKARSTVTADLLTVEITVAPWAADRWPLWLETMPYLAIGFARNSPRDAGYHPFTVLSIALVSGNEDATLPRWTVEHTPSDADGPAVRDYRDVVIGWAVSGFRFG